MITTTTTKGGQVTLNTDRMKLLQKELAKAKGARVHIGVLGDNNSRAEPGDNAEEKLGNADIGLIHEFGVMGGFVRHKTRNAERTQNRKWNQFRDQVTIPERSFLRMPVLQELPTAIYASGKETWRKAILEKGVIYALKRLGILGEAVVQDAFATGGFGRWAPLKPYTIKKKKSNAILIHLALMSQAITSRVITG